MLQGEGGTVESLLASTASLTSTIADRDQVIGQVIDNLNQVLQTVNCPRRPALVADRHAATARGGARRRPAADRAGDLLDRRPHAGDGRVPRPTPGPGCKSDIAALGDLSTQLDAGGPTIEKYLQTAPGKLNTIARAASYGSWFQFYLCSVERHDRRRGSRPGTGPSRCSTRTRRAAGPTRGRGRPEPARAAEAGEPAGRRAASGVTSDPPPRADGDRRHRRHRRDRAARVQRARRCSRRPPPTAPTSPRPRACTRATW